MRAKVLSNRADLVSGGDALIEVVLPAGTDPAKVRGTVDDRELASAFAVRPDGQPWRCDTERQGLGPSVPPFCEAPTKVEFFYRSTDPTKGGWQVYDPENPPSDVARTTTDNRS